MMEQNIETFDALYSMQKQLAKNDVYPASRVAIPLALRILLSIPTCPSAGLVIPCYTHPFENDVYLASHVAIQGTARPTHYHILIDEANVPVDRFQALLYKYYYQYQRATTPASLFPAVYYANLASKRRGQRACGQVPRFATQGLLSVPAYHHISLVISCWVLRSSRVRAYISSYSYGQH